MIDIKAKALEIGEGCTQRYLDILEEALQECFDAGRKSAFEEAAKIAFNFDAYKNCIDKGHDERWCSYCESREDGADAIGQLMESKASSIKG